MLGNSTLIKTQLFLFFVIHSFYGYSQTSIIGSVKDLKTKLPLPYCAVTVKGTNIGSIANQDGIFKISVNPESDTLLFSFIGYKTKVIPATAFLPDAEIFLESKSIALNEVVIQGNEDYLYEIVEHSRKKIREARSHIAKVYFQLETDIDQRPVEILECYYNGYIKGTSIEELLIKNGRIGLAEKNDHGFFLSLNTSKAIGYLSLTEQNDHLPSIPFQYPKSKLKKLYSLNLFSEYSDTNTYHIEFTPRKNTGEYFKAEIWIDKETFSLQKINLSCEKAHIHPFLPLFPCDSLNNVSLYFTETYNKNGNANLLDHLDFKYSLGYKDSGFIGRMHPSVGWYEITTSGVLHFYDYEKPFILPHFKYETEISDYQKILSLPYNEYFWTNNDGLLFTERQKQVLDFLKTNGVLINFHKKFRSYIKEDNKLVWVGLFENNNILWSDSTRISLRKNHLDSLLHKDLSQKNQAFISDLYHLVAQIFLDVNPVKDSIQHYSATIFDIFQSYYDLPEETYTDCFMNIYFDICEIERRKMEKTLCSYSYSMLQIDSIYQQTIKALETQSEIYFKKVQSGKNTQELLKWNRYVLENLNIDNAKIFGLTETRARY